MLRFSIFPIVQPERPVWISKDHFALAQGPVILMIENYRPDLMRSVA